MSAAAALLDRLGRPGDVRLGTAHPEPIPRLPTGLAALDETLGGGLPRGRVIELSGPPGTGRTALACAIAAHATRTGETIAWIDPEDALDPAAAATAGVVLERTLWVRPRSVADAHRAAAIVLGAGGFGLVVVDLTAGVQRMAPAARPQPRALAHAAERSRTPLVVLAPSAGSGSNAALVLEVRARRVRWSGGAGRLMLLDGIDAWVTVARSRVGRPGRALVVRHACA
jgi:RecA/RadA recombinase